MEQLNFKAFELADAVRDLLRVEAEKKQAMEDFGDSIKMLKKNVARLSAEIEAERQAERRESKLTLKRANPEPRA